MNRLSSVTDCNSNATIYTYHEANRMTTTTLPSGTGVVSSHASNATSNSYADANRMTIPVAAAVFAGLDAA